jgi:hypothetical protein
MLARALADAMRGIPCLPDIKAAGTRHRPLDLIRISRDFDPRRAA